MTDQATIEKGYEDIIGQLEAKLHARENALRQATKVFQDILVQCLSRYPKPVTAEGLSEMLEADPIYNLASEGLKTIIQAL